MDNDVKSRIAKVAENKYLSDWERGFCESLAASIDKWGKLTVKQHNLFQKIEAQYTPTKMEELDSWAKDFTLEMRKKMKIVANYYGRYTPYFRGFVQKVLTDEEFIPTKREYVKICENDYAKGVIRNAVEAPRFPVGTFAKIRAGTGHTGRLRKKLLLVVSHSEDVRTHAKGAKPVCVLPVGSEEMIWLEERQLKKPKQKKS